MRVAPAAREYLLSPLCLSRLNSFDGNPELFDLSQRQQLSKLGPIFADDLQSELTKINGHFIIIKDYREILSWLIQTKLTCQ
jgi:hypothetical protein